MKKLKDKLTDEQEIISIKEVINSLPPNQKGEHKTELFRKIMQYEAYYGQKFPYERFTK